MITQTEYNTVCQYAHMLFGAIVVIAWAYLFGAHYVLWAALAFCVYAAGKEFWYDVKYESPDVSGGLDGSVQDFCFYIVGVVIGLSVVGGREFWP